jgi:hypothetical protein
MARLEFKYRQYFNSNIEWEEGRRSYCTKWLLTHGLFYLGFKYLNKKTYVTVERACRIRASIGSNPLSLLPDIIV